MKRFTRPDKKPDTVSISKIHCKYPLVFPTTANREDGKVSLYNDDQERIYSVSTLSSLPPVGEFDRNILLCLLASQQLEMRKKKKAGVYTGEPEDYVLEFDSPNQLLTYMGLDNSGENYKKLQKTLEKLVHTTFHFKGPVRSVKKRRRGFAIVGILDYAEYDYSEDSAGRLIIKLNKTWVNMSEEYFLQYNLSDITALPEKSFTLILMLEQWKKGMLENEKVLVRKISYLCERLGINQDTKKSVIKTAITKAVKQVNDGTNNNYSVSFVGDFAHFTY